MTDRPIGAQSYTWPSNTSGSCPKCGAVPLGVTHVCFPSGPAGCVPQGVPVGWRCPVCSRVHAPSVLSCPYHLPEVGAA